MNRSWAFANSRCQVYSTPLQINSEPKIRTGSPVKVVHGIIERCCRTANLAVSSGIAVALDFVYPPECLLCGNEIGAGNPSFCKTCRSEMKSRFMTECVRCGAPVGSFANLTSGCGQCRRESFAFDRVVRLGVYDGKMRLACLRAKSAGGSGMARGLADALVEDKESLLRDLALDLVLPMPEHWTRRIFHPHYAAETLSRQIARKLGLDWSRSVLAKRRRTAKQATSPTSVRRQQQQGSFRVLRHTYVSGKTILLVDDILTTGSTATAVAKTLKQAGARQVIVAVIAVSPLRK